MPKYEQLNSYLYDPEPTKRELASAWATGIGLQAVDGLAPSKYLLELANDNIENRLSFDTVKYLIQEYYEIKADRANINEKEADLVSVNIAKILSEKAFMAAPGTLISIHRRLFENVFDHAGKIRGYNFTKKEWVLDGDTVSYANYTDLIDILAFDFEQEKKINYNAFSNIEAANHIAKFASNIWQAHPFCEGNTRTTAVFLVKYLNKKGFKINNDYFLNNSLYFRNALVRANYENRSKNISFDFSYLNQFFENLIAEKHYELKNRYLNINFNNSDKTLHSNIRDNLGTRELPAKENGHNSPDDSEADEDEDGRPEP